MHLYEVNLHNEIHLWPIQPTDISVATTLAADIVALIAPALVQAFKKYIPADYVGLTSLGVSILLGVIAIAATNGFHGYVRVEHRPHRRHRRRTSRLHLGEPSAQRQTQQRP